MADELYYLLHQLLGASGPGLAEKLTTYTIRSAGAVNANGVNWVTLLDQSVLAKDEEIRGITLTVAGGWAGLSQVRIVTAAGTVIFPFTGAAVENTDYVSGVSWVFAGKVYVPAATGYKVQFSSTNAGDAGGKTMALTELDVIQKG